MGLAFLLASLAIGLSIPLSLCVLFLRHRKQDEKAIAVVVLGDIGRSPRMIYHAQSLLKTGYKVYLIGYAGTPVLPSLADSPNVTLIHIGQPPAWLGNLPRPLFLLIAAPTKLLLGAVSLLMALLFGCPTRPKAVFVQTPPALPTLPIVQLATFLQGNHLLIDWHNTSFSILAMRLGKSSLPTRIAKKLEGFFGRSADAHFFVTKAMKESLSADWQLQGDKHVFHDVPQAALPRLVDGDRLALFSRLSILQSPSLEGFVPSSSADQKLAVIVSSTSWTADEDFSILLRALDGYEQALNSTAQSSSLPKLLVLITGKGALKSAFEKEVEQREKAWKSVRCRTAWLESGNYPRLLGSADLGISLHSSSSGLDLPMKIVDMFGAGTPVLALDFPCIGELVQDGKNGRVFSSAAQLSQQLQDLLAGFPQSAPNLDALREGTRATQGVEWQEAWEQTVLPVVQKQ